LVQAVYEEQVDVPVFLQERLEKALVTGDGKAIAHTGQANQAIIGLPTDASWNEPSRFVLYDEDEPGVHRTLMAQTRLGDESRVIIPLWVADGFSPDVTPNFAQAKHWFLRAMNISRKGVVKKVQTAGVPEGWKKSSLLRNCFPLVLNDLNCWTEDETVRLDDDLGLIYETQVAG
jgi:CRISPR-associated endonuclease/helicase Cas3